MKLRHAFTLIELLVVIAIIAILAAILFPVFAQAKAAAKKIACLSNEKQLGTATYLYLADNDEALYHHHEQWVLDDGTLVNDLPANISGCLGGGFGNSQAEKPWAVFFQPYMKSRQLLFCPVDGTTKSTNLTSNINDYNGGTGGIGTECSVSPKGEQCQAEQNNLTMWSYSINSIFTHKSCRYAVEGVLPGFATESVIAGLADPNIIMFSERNSEGEAEVDLTKVGSSTIATTGEQITSMPILMLSFKSGAKQGLISIQTTWFESRSRTRHSRLMS
jgi:prepilin-type N-terminal cleavage/methylation domain-containing protein